MKCISPSLKIQVVASDGMKIRARIIAKPSRYSQTRYWVVLSKASDCSERWLLVPTPEKAIEQIYRWLVPLANQFFAMNLEPHRIDSAEGTGGASHDTQEDISHLVAASDRAATHPKKNKTKQKKGKSCQ